MKHAMRTLIAAATLGFLLTAMVFHVYALIPGPEPSISPSPSPTTPSLPPFYFFLQLTPPSATVEQGQTANYMILVTYSHPLYSGTMVNIQVMGLDPSMQYQLSTSENLAISTSAATPAGSYPVTVIGSANGVAQQASGTLIVTAKPPPFDYSVTMAPSNQTVGLGKTATYVLTVSLVSGSAEQVTLNSAGLPPDIQNSLSPLSGIPTYQSTLTVDTSTSTSTGIYTITVTATGGGLTKTATATINVQKQSNEPQATPTTSPQKTEKQQEELKTSTTVESQSTAVIEEFMRLNQLDSLKANKYALAEILAMLVIFEAALQATKSKKLEEMLYARLKADSARDLGWLKELQIIILIIIIVFLLLILALSM